MYRKDRKKKLQGRSSLRSAASAAAGPASEMEIRAQNEDEWGNVTVAFGTDSSFLHLSLMC